MNAEREKRLPKWAQQELKTMRMRVREAEKTAMEMIAGESEAYVVAFRDGSHVEIPLIAPHVRFRFGPEHWNYVDARVELHEKKLVVSSGSTDLGIRARAANVIHVRPVGY